MTVRRHINWNTQRPDLREDLAHLVQYIKRRVPIYMTTDKQQTDFRIVSIIELGLG